MTTSRQSRNRKNVTPTAPKAKTAGAPAAVVSDKPSSTAAATAAPAPATTGAYSWTHDYDYVKKDLRKLGIVSFVLFAAIIIAGFFM